jgi:hypothetical protein
VSPSSRLRAFWSTRSFVNTGGTTAAQRQAIAQQAQAVGALSHTEVDAQQLVFSIAS